MNKQKANKIERFFLAGILLVVLISFVSASYSLSNFGIGDSDKSLSFDDKSCEAGQDFLIKISSFGCTPSVVRSDLLEEQNVPVFCQLSATKLNPLIDVEAIESISFKGDYPDAVSGIGFYPAKSALSAKQDINYPVLNNIGYVTIVLKEQANESSMPDVVKGNLTANIKYDIKNAFGVGKANFYLPSLTDEEWEERYFQYGFWEKKGYLRAENIESNSATISVYNKNLQKTSSVNLEKGKTSKEIYIPGFDYCQGSLQLRLDSVEAADTRARLRVNEDIVEVARREKFLDNKCTVIGLERDGLVQNVEIRCDEDEGRKTITLRIEPKIKISIDGEEREVGVGDYLYEDEEKNEFVYLGHIGAKKDSTNIEDIYLFVVRLPEFEKKLSQDKISSIGNFVDKLEYKDLTGNVVTDVLLNSLRLFGAGSEALFRRIVEGQAYRIVSYPEIEEVFGQEIQIIDFVDVQDKELNGAEEYYQNAIGDYKNIVENFAGEKYPENSRVNLGEEALYQQIILARDLGQGKTMVDLCENFKEKYPDSDIDLSDCDDSYKLSNSEISTDYVKINGKTEKISFDGIYEPGFYDYGAEVLVEGPNGERSLLYLSKDQTINLDDFRDEENLNEFIQLVSLDDDSARLKINLAETGLKKLISSDNKNLKKDISESFGSDYIFTLKDIHLEKSAKVSVIPNINNVGTEANFSFQIGIEKRWNLTLAPDTIEKRIDALNGTIGKLQNISDTLGDVIKVGKTACLGTGAVLTIKNFLANLEGTGIARQKVMRGENGWYEKCTDLVEKGEYVSLEQCFLENSDKIDKDVEEVTEIINKQDKEIKKIQEQFTESKFLSEKVVDTDKFMEEFTEKVQEEISVLGNSFEDPRGKGESINIEEMRKTLSYEGWKQGYYSTEKLKEIELALMVLESGADEDLKNIYRERLYSDLSEVQANSESFAEISNLANDLNVQSSQISFLEVGERVKEITYGGLTNKDTEIQEIDENVPVSVLQTSRGDKLILILDDSSGTEILPIKRDEDDSLVVYGVNGNRLSSEELSGSLVKELDQIYFKKYDKSSYENSYKNAELKYYETEPYKGFPAIVPFDLGNGWYAATKQTISTGASIASYDKSGQVNSFYLCNVGKNGIQEFYSSAGDDNCRGFNLGTGQAYDQFAGLKEKETKDLVECAVDAIEQASDAYESEVSRVRIRTSCGGTVTLKVGEPAADIPDIQCQDFMSPKDCNLLFNVCDPFICPSSRCDFGGAYPVKDVVQSGIIGSLILCLPNAQEGIAVPVCITGIKAGTDGWLSVMESYRDCLQESLETGKNMGICDEMHSVYLCEFFWKQALPLADLAVPKVLEAFSGQGTQGGGEYLSVQNAWENAENSLDYFTQSYATESYKAFQARSTGEAGTLVCKTFASAAYADTGSLFDAMTEAESPAQYHGNFEEITFSTVTSPPTSHYKVFYHIYAGENSGAYYKVYLKGSSESFYQDASRTRQVASGYVAAGDYASETEDFTAPSGYTQMCINVNGEEECGFKEVSTSFAADYITDSYAKEQIEKSDITTEEECVSGTVSVYSLLDLNLQSSVEELIDPAIYEKGITRVCATDNPGKGTDPYSGTEDSRWVEVGYCDSENMKCWLDTKSIKDAIELEGVEEEALDTVTKSYMDILREEGDYLSEKEFEKKLEEIEEEENSEEKIKLVEEILDRVFLNNKRAYLLLLRGNAYGDLALNAFRGVISKVTGGEAGGSAGVGDETGAETGVEGDMSDIEKTYEIDRIGFKIDDKEAEFKEDVKKQADEDVELVVEYEYNCEYAEYQVFSPQGFFKGLVSGFDWNKQVSGRIDKERVDLLLNKLDEETYYVNGYCFDEKGNSKKTKSNNLIVAEVSGEEIIETPSLFDRYEKIVDENDENLFDKYAEENLPEGWNPNKFKALLVAIAIRQSNLGYPEGIYDPRWIMEYGWEVREDKLQRIEKYVCQEGTDVNGLSSEEVLKCAEAQIKDASKTLKFALDKSVNKESDYSKCDKTIYRLRSDSLIKCVLSVYMTGENSKIIGESEGEKYAKEVMEIMKEWEDYFSKNS